MTQIAAKKDAEIAPLDALHAAPKVKIRVHKTSAKGEQPFVYVGVNGIGYQIKRGEDVMVPEPVAKVLENATQTLYEFDPENRTRTQRQAQAYPFTYVN